MKKTNNLLLCAILLTSSSLTLTMRKNTPDSNDKDSFFSINNRMRGYNNENGTSTLNCWESSIPDFYSQKSDSKKRRKKRKRPIYIENLEAPDSLDDLTPQRQSRYSNRLAKRQITNDYLTMKIANMMHEIPGITNNTLLTLGLNFKQQDILLARKTYEKEKVDRAKILEMIQNIPNITNNTLEELNFKTSNILYAREILRQAQDRQEKKKQQKKLKKITEKDVCKSLYNQPYKDTPNKYQIIDWLCDKEHSKFYKLKFLKTKDKKLYQHMLNMTLLITPIARGRKTKKLKTEECNKIVSFLDRKSAKDVLYAILKKKNK